MGEIILITTVTATTASTTSSAAAGIMSMTTPVGLPEYGVLAIIALIILLSAKEILSASRRWSRTLDCSLNTPIISLFMAFVAIVVFKITEII